MSEVYYEGHVTHDLHTARISSVNSAMFVDGNKKGKPDIRHLTG